jgi:hypothetical protein
MFIVMAALLTAAAAWSQQEPQPPRSDNERPGPASQHHPAGIHYMRGVWPAATIPATTTPPAIPYNGGTILPTDKTYAIWWGNPSDFPSDAQDGIEDLFQGFQGSAYLGIANQYMLGKTAQSHFGRSLFDYSAPPTQDPSNTVLVSEVCTVLSNNGIKPSPTAVYNIYTSNFPNESYYCAFHDFGACADGTIIHYTYVPNSSGIPGCYVAPPDLSCNNRSVGTQAMANSTAHELMESITDPEGTSWVNYATGNEIGDSCNFLFTKCVYLSNGSRWQLQTIWSDKKNACVQGAGEGDD